MKINIISDIHADYNSKTGKVIYNLPFKHSKKKYIDLFEILYTDWFTETDFHKLLKYDYSNASKYTESFVEYFEDCQELKCEDDITRFMNDFKTYIYKDFDGIDRKTMFRFSRSIDNLNILYLKNGHNPLYKKSKLKIVELADYMFKKIYDFDPSKLESADYLIIAGDLGLDNTYDVILKDIEKKTKGKFKKILHISGNHDHWWYGNGINGETRPERIDLSHDYCEFVDGDYVFLGCTMWTPVTGYDSYTVERYMNDYRYIPGRISTEITTNQFHIQTEWLRNKLNFYKDKKVIVFTHHQPFEELTCEDYKHNGKNWDGIDVNAAYVVMDHSLDNIGEEFKNIKLWCCGHTHQNFDGILHGIRVIRNPIGYRDHYGYKVAENDSGTWYNKIVEL